MKPGICTLCLQLIRRVKDLIPKFQEMFSHVENEFVAQIFALLFCCFILPKIVDFVIWTCEFIGKIIKKFE